MIPASAPEQTVLQAKRYKIFLKIEIANISAVYLDYSDYANQDFQYRAEIGIDVDARIAQATLDLIRESAGNSLAPLLNSDIAVGRGVRLSAARIAAGASPVAGDYKPLFAGTIDEWGHPTVGGMSDENRLTLVARDGLAVLQDRWVEEETDYGSEDGTPIESVMQSILDDWADGAQLYVPTPTGINAGLYRQEKTSVLDGIQALADLIGWVIEYRWDSVTAAWRITLYEPDRTPASTQWTFGPDDYFDVVQLQVARYHIRNAVTVRYTDAATGARAEYTVTDPTSIAKYGRRWMEIEEADDSPINSAALAEGMADPALLDLAEPSANQEIRGPLFWPVQLSDFYGFLANLVHYDVDQEFGVNGYTHVLENGTGETLIRTRGKPVGSIRGWLQREHKQRPPREKERAEEILNFREISRTTTEIVYSWRLGSDLAMSWIHDYQEPQPYSNDKWPDGTRLPESVTDVREVEYTVTIPEQGFVGYFQVEGRRADGSLADVERVLIFPLNVAGDYIAFAAMTVNQSDGSVKITGWTTDRAQSVAYAYNVGTAATTDPPTEAQAEAQGVGATGGGLVTGFTSDFEISLPTDTVVPGEVIKALLIAYINADGTGPDGTAQDHDTPVGVQGERFKVTRSDQLENLIVTANKLTESSRHFGFSGVFSAIDWDSVQWTAGDLLLAGPVTYAISSGSVNLPDSDLVFVYFDKAVSTTALQTTDSMATATQGEGKILIAAVKRAPASNQDAAFYPAVGQLGLNEDNLSVNSVATDTLQANSVTAVKANIATLSSLTANVGLLLAGVIQNADGSVVIDLDATGAAPFIDADDFRLFADGSAEFAGVITAAVAVLQGGLQVDLDSLFLGNIQHDGDRVGFYGTTAILKQTGVAVTAAGVHAALVNLGLIAA